MGHFVKLIKICRYNWSHVTLWGLDLNLGHHERLAPTLLYPPSSPYGKSAKLPSFDCRKRLVTFAMDVMTRFCLLALVNGPQQVLSTKHTVSIWVMPREILLCLTWRRTRRERLVRIQYLRGVYFCVGGKEFKPCSTEFWRCLGVSFPAVIRIRGKKLIVFFFRTELINMTWVKNVSLTPLESVVLSLFVMLWWY